MAQFEKIYIGKVPKRKALSGLFLWSYSAIPMKNPVPLKTKTSGGRFTESCHLSVNEKVEIY